MLWEWLDVWEVHPELSNHQQLERLLSYFDSCVKDINRKTSNAVSLSTYAHDERVIKGAISEIKMFTAPNMLPSYTTNVWGVKSDDGEWEEKWRDELKRSICNYLEGINGINRDGGDILQAIADKAEVFDIISTYTQLF